MVIDFAVSNLLADCLTAGALSITVAELSEENGLLFGVLQRASEGLGFCLAFFKLLFHCCYAIVASVQVLFS